MITIEKKKLPHGEIPFIGISDLDARTAIMKLNENVKSLSKQLKVAQDAIIEMQRR